MTARADFEYAVWNITGSRLTRGHMDAILIAADAYAARCIAQPVSDVADHPLITAGRRMAAVAEADAKIGRRPARNRQGETL